MPRQTIAIAIESPSDKVLGKRGVAMLNQLISLAATPNYQITELGGAMILICLEDAGGGNLTLRISNLLSKRFYRAKIGLIRQSITVTGASPKVKRALSTRHNIPEKVLKLAEVLV